jgi:hypothetical protein
MFEHPHPLFDPQPEAQASNRHAVPKTPAPPAAGQTSNVSFTAARPQVDRNDLFRGGFLSTLCSQHWPRPPDIPSADAFCDPYQTLTTQASVSSPEASLFRPLIPEIRVPAILQFPAIEIGKAKAAKHSGTALPMRM